MFLFYVLSFFKKGDTIQGRTLFKGGILLKEIWYVMKHFYKFLSILLGLVVSALAFLAGGQGSIPWLGKSSN